MRPREPLRALGCLACVDTQARAMDGVGVFSFARYAPSWTGEEGGTAGADGAARMLRRCAKVLVHETGHIFGMRHCIHWHCRMNGGAQPAGAPRPNSTNRRRTARPLPSCRRLVPLILWSCVRRRVCALRPQWPRRVRRQPHASVPTLLAQAAKFRRVRRVRALRALGGVVRTRASSVLLCRLPCPAHTLRRRDCGSMPHARLVWTVCTATSPACPPAAALPPPSHLPDCLCPLWTPSLHSAGTVNTVLRRRRRGRARV